MPSGDDPVSRLVGFAKGPAARAPRAPGRVDIALTAATYVALLVAMMPLARVVNSGPWTIGVVLLPALLLVTGWIARRFRLPAVAVSLAETLVGILALTAVFLGGTALFGLIPTPRSFATAGELISSGVNQIINGAAPLDAVPGLAFLIVGGMLVLTIIVDHVILTARMPLLAAVALIAVWLIPAIAVPAEIDAVAFVLLAIVILVILRLETRSRERDAAAAAGSVPAETDPGVLGFAGAGIAAAAAGIGAVAVVVSLVAAPVFSGLVIRPATGPGAGRFNSIDASLQLGDDLRKQSNSEVLRFRTTAAAAPYLRVATLTDFDGEIWRPDRGRSVSLESDEAYSSIRPGEEVRIVEATTSIEVLNLASSSAPVTYPAVGVEGLDGEWGSIPFNGTVVSRSASVNGQDYQVMAEYPRPTLEQIRAADARPTGALEATTVLPSGVPPIIAQLAQEITVDATNDYDSLQALQRWFRSSEFEYSLEAPVQDGFDGSGAEAIAEFLDVREGYCIHFASAFAVMARTLDMPSRIVVGYLPGSAMSDAVMGDRVYSVMASQLHAWPEVFFAGIGWIPFEPTNSLGTPTSFSPAAVSADGPLEDGADPSAAPTDGATPTPTLLPEGIEERGSDASSSADPAVRALPWLGPLLGLLLIGSIPGLIREARRRSLLASARAVDPVAAWRLLQDDAIDLGIPVPPDESPRSFGARLVTLHGAPPEAVDTLVEAIELSSYAPRGYRWRGTDLAAPEIAVRDALRAGSSRMLRIAAVVAPRSLLIRPGSVYAGDGLRTRERVGSR